MAVERDWERRIGGRLKLRDLHILSKVVEWGSMARAASHLGMSQPAVSEAIANLEAALRVRLLDRNVRGIEPTIYAATLLKRERIVFDELQQGIKEIEFLLNPEAGEVRLGTSEILAAGLVPKVIDRLLRRYPKSSSACRSSTRQPSNFGNCVTATSTCCWREFPKPWSTTISTLKSFLTIRIL